VRAEKFRHGRLRRLATGDGQDQVGKGVVGGRQPQVVECKEDKGRDSADSLVPVDERVVLDKVE
jgi:hypothetical protein